MSQSSNDRSVDPALVARVAREVIARMTGASATPPATTSPATAPPATSVGKLVTIESLTAIADKTEVHAPAGTVITPAARDEASRRGIRFATAASNSSPKPKSTPVADCPLAEQLRRRGIVFTPPTKILWTREPALEVFRRCSSGQPAVMISAFSDVERFAAEFSPSVWVLDAVKLNLSAAVNVATRISRLPGQPKEATR